MSRFHERLRAVVRRTRDGLWMWAIRALLRASRPPISHGARDTLVVEGMWSNPNHWLRLWMFLHAALKDRPADVVAVMQEPTSAIYADSRRNLEALGVVRFEHPAPTEEGHLRRADEILGRPRTLRDLLSLELPDEMPAYVFVDTALKRLRHPQPTVEGNPVWRETVADLLRWSDFYSGLFADNRVTGVVSSHAWKNEWAALCWQAIRRSVPFFYMTAHYGSIRIRRMRRPDDYRAPNEHLRFDEYQALPVEARAALVARGREYLDERYAGRSDFVVLRYSVHAEQRGRSREQFLREFGFDPSRKLAVVYSHAWYDFPHTQAMRNFTEPLDWLLHTIETIRPLTHLNWAIKPHPCDLWYDDLRISDLIGKLPPNIRIVPERTDSLAMQEAADVFVTIHGSIGIEAAAMGKPVLCADRSMYTDWGFTHCATSREDYERLLRGIADLAPPTAEQSERAFAFAATALAPPAGADTLTLTCDTRVLDGSLHPAVARQLLAARPALYDEVELIREWLGASIDSYNVWRVVRGCLGGRA